MTQALYGLPRRNDVFNSSCGITVAELVVTVSYRLMQVALKLALVEGIQAHEAHQLMPVRPHLGGLVDVQLPR